MYTLVVHTLATQPTVMRTDRLRFTAQHRGAGQRLARDIGARSLHTRTRCKRVGGTGVFSIMCVGWYPTKEEALRDMERVYDTARVCVPNVKIAAMPAPTVRSHAKRLCESFSRV